MKRNVRIKQQTRFACNSGRIIFLIAITVTVFGLYLYQDMRCDSLQQKIGHEDRRLKALDQEVVRETAKFNSMTTREKLNEALNRFGLKMDYPSSRQRVRMDARGRPYPGQLALASVQKRATTERVARSDENANQRQVAPSRKVRR